MGQGFTEFKLLCAAQLRISCASVYNFYRKRKTRDENAFFKN